jgi:butyrate kinase
MLGIFMPCLKCIADLMEKQINTASSRKNGKVDKVVLIGGFGDNPALQEYLTERIATIGARIGHKITAVYSKKSVTRVL